MAKDNPRLDSKGASPRMRRLIEGHEKGGPALLPTAGQDPTRSGQGVRAARGLPGTPPAKPGKKK